MSFLTSKTKKYFVYSLFLPILLCLSYSFFGNLFTLVWYGKTDFIALSFSAFFLILYLLVLFITWGDGLEFKKKLESILIFIVISFLVSLLLLIGIKEQGGLHNFTAFRATFAIIWLTTPFAFLTLLIYTIKTRG